MSSGTTNAMFYCFALVSIAGMVVANGIQTRASIAALGQTMKALTTAIEALSKHR